MNPSSFKSDVWASDAVSGASGDVSKKRSARPVGARLWRHTVGRWSVCAEWVWGRALRRRSGELARQRAALGAHAAVVERAFVTTGAALNQQTVLTGSLVEQGRRLAAFTAASTTDNPVRRAIAFVEETLRTLDALQQECNALTEGLRNQQHEIVRLQTHAAMLDRAIAPLRIVDTLFRIEAATLPVEMQTAFAALTHDIAELDGRVRQTFAKHFEALGVTSTAIDNVLRHLERKRAEHDEAAAAQRAALRESLATLEGNIARLRRQEEGIAAAVAEIDRDSNGIVVALQYQDIMRQKLEHVVSALELLEQRVANGTARVAFVGHAACLQAGQLVAVQADLETALGQINSGLERIVDRLREVEDAFLGRHDRADVSADARLVIDTIAAILPILLQAVEGAAENGRVASNAVQAYGDVAADIGTTVGELTWGIRLIALNAQVQAAQVDRCDGLEVLARHTYVVSDETAELAEALGRDLARLNAQLRVGIQQTKAFSEHTLQVRNAFDSGAQGVRRDLGAQRETVVIALDEFGPLLRQTREHAARLLDRGELGAVHPESLAGFQLELERLATWCGEHGGNDDQDASVRAAIDSMGAKYTMQSERVVHRRVLDGRDATRSEAFDSTLVETPNSPPASVSVPVATVGSRDLGGNVELF